MGCANRLEGIIQRTNSNAGVATLNLEEIVPCHLVDICKEFIFFRGEVYYFEVIDGNTCV